MSEKLVDISTVEVDKSLPQPQRIVEYVRQIKDPYHFKSGEMNVKAIYPNNGKSMEDCLRSAMT
jgi:hypothetical protein